jgi:phage gpG-like protein
MADVRIVGAEALRVALTKISSRTNDLRPAWPRIDKYFSMVFLRQFATEGTFLGGMRWRGWSPAWAKRRVRPGGNRGGILRDTSVLWGSFVNPNDANSERIMDPLQYERGSKVPYAIAHQLGKGVPKREILPDRLPAAVEMTILKTVANYAVEGTK